MKWLAFAMLAACADAPDAGGPWQAIEEITGELAVEVGPAPAASAADCRLRVATWNVHFAEAPDDLAKRIKNSRELASADVLLVQEIRAFSHESASRSARLATALGMTWIYAPAITLDGGGTHGVAILSKLPLADALVRQLPYMDRPVAPEQRIALGVTVDGLRIVNVHLDTRIGPVDRVRQLHPAVNDLAETMLLGGDFNTSPWAWVDGVVPLTSSEAILGQEQAAVIDDYLAHNRFASAVPVETDTLPLSLFAMRIDDLYARGLPITAAGVEQLDGSDHWPVWFDVDRCQK